jgi:hypothetical protein
MQKKNYVQPATQVVKLQHECALLQASKPDYDSVSWSRRNDYVIDEDVEDLWHEEY